MDLDLTLAALGVFAGLVIAGHGARKALAMFGGPGLAGWTKGVQQMGFATPRSGRTSRRGASSSEG